MSKSSKAGGASGAGEVGSEGPGDLTQEERIDATMWRVLRDVALVAMLRPLAKRTVDLTVDQQNELLGPLVPSLVGAHGMLRECARQYYLLGIGRVHDALHDAPGVDHEMLSEAIDFHGRVPDHEEPPYILE
jgi:hypothetical protein